MLLYILNTVLASGLALLFYHLLLKHEKTFVFNRFYLLGSLMLCLVAPLLSIEAEVPVTISDVSEVLSIESSVTVVDDYETTIVEDMNSSSFNFWHGILMLYGFVSLVLIFRFFRNFVAIMRLTKPIEQTIGKLKIVAMQESSNSFSFFNYIFIDKVTLANTEATQLILKHEKAHCQQKHSIDIICIEVLKCMFWFNPFVWLCKRAIVENHEFLADEAVVTNGVGISKYSKSLIHTQKSIVRYAMSSGFNIIQTKNRLKMLHQSKSTVMKTIVKSTTVLILFAMVFMVSISASYKAPIVVVVDAGHGGKDSGHLDEKTINLNIAKLLKAKSNRKVTIKLLRENDDFLTLQERAKRVNALKPDLFLSIHCNASKDASYSGVEAYYFENGKYKDASHTFSKLLVSAQLDATVEKGRVKTASFYLLKHIDCTASFLELGFLTNPKDKKRLTSKAGQLETANAIFDALEVMQMQH